MSTSSSPPAPSPSSPPSSNSTAPPPSPPSAPSPSNSTSPPPSTPLAPPPSTPSAPPPSTPSAHPPSTPSTPSAPPPSTPSAPPSSTPSTPSAPPPSTPSSPPSTPSAPSPPAPLTPSPPPPSGRSPPVTHSPPSTKPPPSSRSPPSHSSSSSSSSSISTPAVVGIAVGAVVILAVLSLICICCRKKRRRVDPPFAYYSGAPPPLPPQKDDIYGGQPPSWQHSASPPPDHVVRIPPQPLAPPPHASRPPHQLPHYPTTAPSPPPPISGSSAGSGSLYSEPLPPPSPSFALGFSKSTFTFEELAVATNGFSDANLLGQGGFGYVHKGVLPNGQEVAIKQLKSGSGQGEREFQAEVEIISRVHHRHLVSLVGYCMAEEQRLLVYEYVPNKTLDFHLHGKDVPTMDWPTRLKLALGSAKGLAYLHEDCHPKIIHRDIKASNILLDFKFEAKVADFGLAKFASDNNTHISTRVMGTFGYLAPEYASSGKLTEKSDVFSFGVMLLELITGRKPVDSTETYIDDSLVDWARPLMARAMEDGIYDTLTDPQLGRNYNHNEMARLVACAASCVRHSARRRPRMSQIVRALEGNVSLEDLNEGIRPGHSTLYGNSHGSSDYDSSQYNEDMKKFRKMALATRDYASSECSVPTSEYGQIPSAPSSSEGQGQDTREMEMAKIKKDKTSQGFSSGSQL